MFAVRYVALAALVIWLGLAGLLLARTLFGDLFTLFDLIAAACAAIIFVCLFVMKFVGPPPRAFVMRAGIAFVMFTLAVYTEVLQRRSTTLLTIDIALGLVLLSWYARE